MKNEKGFTLIELLLVVMIIGFMLAVILPRGLRATTDSKYNLVRQNGAELAAFANDWIEQQILAQDETSTATRADYLRTLVHSTSVGPVAGVPDGAAWIADATFSNWNQNSGGTIVVDGRCMNDAPPCAAGVDDALPENTVEEIIDPAKVLRNPFNGASVFLPAPNDPETATAIIPGTIACTAATDISTGGTFDYYALIFQGTDSTEIAPPVVAPGDVDATTAIYHAGMAPLTLPGARQGVFFTKVRQ